MDALLLLIQAVLIFGVAFIYSNLGLGGGLLFVPILLSTGVPDKDLAVPISLTLTIATATSSVINHHRRGLVDFRLGGVLLAGALLGAVVGTVFTLKVLSQETFEAFFAAVLIVFGVFMVRDWMKNARSVDEDNDSAMTPPRVAGTAAATTGSGFLSGSMGIGGGLLNVPLLVYVLGRKTRKAIGTSSLLIIPTAAVGFGRRVVDVDSALRVCPWRDAPLRGYHRRGDQPRVRPRVHFVGLALRSVRAAQGLLVDRIRRERDRPPRDGRVREHVPVLSGKSPRGISGRGERPRWDRPPHGDLEALGVARATGSREPHRSDGLGRRIGPRDRLACNRTGTRQCGALVDARALRDRRGARAALGAPRPSLDPRARRTPRPPS